MEVTYNYSLVGLSVLIAIFSAHMALTVASRVPIVNTARQANLLISGSLGMGTGIWSMHYVAILALSLGIPMFYNVFAVLLSLVIAVIVSTIALYIISLPVPTPSLIGSGSVLMGVSISGMHYIGMASMEVAAVLHYHLLLSVLSIALAVAAAWISLVLSLQFREDRSDQRPWLKLPSACFMGGAIVLMHYTAMLACSFTPLPDAVILPLSLTDETLTMLVCGLTVLVLCPIAFLLYAQPYRWSR